MNVSWLRKLFNCCIFNACSWKEFVSYSISESWKKCLNYIRIAYREAMELVIGSRYCPFFMSNLENKYSRWVQMRSLSDWNFFIYILCFNWSQLVFFFIFYFLFFIFFIFINIHVWTISCIVATYTISLMSSPIYKHLS